MHELSVTTNLLNLALRHAGEAHARRITGLHLVVGQLSSMVDDSVAFYWDIISQDTIAQGARLDFRRIPALFRCGGCGLEYEMPAETFACPACGSETVCAVAGDEFYLESIDVEAEDDPPINPEAGE